MASNIREPAGVSHKWQPIAPLGETGYDFQEITSLQREWLRIKRDVERDTPQAYAEFTARLTRRQAIETGIIEGVYELDRGVTETLVEKGFVADYIERRYTNKEPSELMAILNDHQDAVASVNMWIKEGRPLTKWFICALHSQILNSQHTSRAIDQFGNPFNATLVKGEFKKRPNNPTRPDRTIHEYCPPEQVDSEIENLIHLYEEYSADDNCHPLLLAAWQHHRFQQIHPFQDGNGRVGRAILNWYLVKNEFFPIVISRADDRIEHISALEKTDRTKYISALEKADTGDLTPLIDLLVRFQKNTILLALNAGDAATSSASEFQPQADLISEVVGGIVARVKFRRQQQSEVEQMRSVNNTALELRRQTQDYLHQKSQEIQEQLAAAGIHVDPQVIEGGPDYNDGHWYGFDALETAEYPFHQVNFFEPRYFVRLSMDPSSSAEKTPSLTFVVSLHHAGRRLTGIMAATAFARIEHYGDTGSSPIFNFNRALIQALIGLDMSNFKSCAAEPFTFTWNDPVEDISGRFTDWTEVCFGVALRYWMESF